MGYFFSNFRKLIKGIKFILYNFINIECLLLEELCFVFLNIDKFCFFLLVVDLEY